MTDPSSKTVRGWQVDILAALGGFAALPTLVEEVQYLNRRLFGFDSTGAALPVEQRPALRDALVSLAPDSLGQLVQTGLMPYLIQRLGSQPEPTIGQQLETLAPVVNGIFTALYDEEGERPVGVTADIMRGQLITLASYLGAPVGNRTVAQALALILAALGEIGQNGGPLSAREYLAGILVQTTRQADCCEQVEPPVNSAPAWNPDTCPEHSLLTATFQFTGEITASGALPVGVGLNSLPPNFTSDPGDGLTGPLLRYTGVTLGSCWYVAVDPEYTGTVGASINAYTIPGYGTDTGRPNPPDANPGPSVFTLYATAAAPSEAALGYGVSIAIGPGDPPLQGSQVVVYVGRPDPELG